MESYLNENFGDVKPKNSSEEALQRWRKLCWLVKNPKRRFRFTANLSKRSEAEAIRRSNQEKLRVAVLVSQAAFQFIQDQNSSSLYIAPEEVKAAGFEICADELASIVEVRNVKKLNIHGGVEACVCGKVKEIGSSKVSSDFLSGIPVSALRVLLQSIFNNTRGEVVRNKDGKIEILGTPTETAILEFGLSLYGNFQQERPASKIVQVEPFNSLKKRMGVVLQLPDGCFRAHCKGASEIILAECDKVIDSNGEVVPLHEQSISDLRNTIENFASEGLRTLCLAYKEIGSEYSVGSPIPITGYTCIGIVGIKDPVRPGVRESIAICRSAGITVRMVTGDNINTAKAIARECGILTDGIAIEGHEFREKSEAELLDIIPKIQVMARSTPMDKLELVKLLRKTFEDVVAVTGDGTNDAPALHEADIGLAMGIAGTEVAKESADVIILDDNFCTISTVAKWGRSVYINIQKFVQFQLTVNIVALIVNFSSACLTGNAPLTAVQLLWVNLIMDTLGALALALATEPPTDDLMTRPPVGRKGDFISNVMWRNILGQALYQFVIIWFLLARGKVAFHLDGPDSDSVLNTLIFNSFVFCQVFNEISCREMERINVFNGILKNYVFVAVFTCTILFQIMIIECLGTYANTYPLSLEQWFGSVFLGFLGMPVAAALKLVPANYTYTGQNFSTSSAFIDHRSGESRGALSESPRLPDPSASENSDDLIRHLVSDLGSHSIDKRKEAAMIIRLLAKDKPEYRLKIAKAGAVKPLISLMSSPDLALQETSVTSILNLSLCDENKELIASCGGIKPLVGALETGTSTAKENAACALIHLSQIEKNKIAIGRSGAMPLLVDLLKKGSLRGKKDASEALYCLCSVKENKMRAVQAGITKLLVELMDDFGSNMVDQSAFVLSVLASVPEGRRSLVDEGGIPVLVKIVDVGSQLQKEIAVIILSHICKDSMSHLNTVALEGAIPPLIFLSLFGTNLAKQNAKTLLENLRKARTGNAAARMSEGSV
ncbi:hypothetical protein L6164_015506 [Bauhinia variegata]|uniref:Uncharacterized protein n=1 Tax=Bauhinia variegata TaxID=167791 RepID=A0ACB9NKH5_BAUVA|nr:hypothetical protein L6164_015506 [Bauhinia variegata]